MRNNHVLAILLVFLLSAPIALYSGLNDPPLLRGGSDFASGRPFDQYYQDPSLYATDEGMHRMLPAYLPTYHKIMAKLLVTQNDLFVYLLISILLWVVFISGMYAITFRLLNNIPAAVIAALSCAFGYRAFSGIFWGVQIGQVMPRDWFVALTPWLVLLLLRCRKLWHYGVLFFALGVLANIHFVEVWLLVGFLLLISLLHDRAVLRAGVSITAALLGSLPAFFQQEPLGQNIAVMHERMPYLFSLGFQEAALWMLVPVLLAVFGWTILSRVQQRLFRSVFIAAAVVSVGGHLVAQFFPDLLLLQFSRASRLFYLVLLPVAAAGITHFFLKNNRRKVAALGLMALLMIPIPLWAPRLTSSAEPSTALPPEEFAQVTAWAQQTPRDALFLVPPDSFAQWFRPNAQRSVVVTYKDGANLILTMGGAEWWRDRYAAVRSVYAQNRTSVFLDAAEEYNADYIIVDRQQHQLDLPIAYQNARFAVYEVHDSESETRA